MNAAQVLDKSTHCGALTGCNVTLLGSVVGLAIFVLIKVAGLTV